MKIAIRVRGDWEIYAMERGSSGDFEFGDARFGNEKHHSNNLQRRVTLDDAIVAIGIGLHPRTKGQTAGQWNMIAPQNTIILEVPR